jgi:hypothetical protein
MQKWMWRKAVHDANLCYGCHHICGNTTEDKRWDALFPSLLPKSEISLQDAALVLTLLLALAMLLTSCYEVN